MKEKNLAIAIKLMKAQVAFLATQQKEQNSLNKKIISYSKNVLNNYFRVKNQYSDFPDNFKAHSYTSHTFQVYSHLKKS